MASRVLLLNGLFFLLSASSAFALPCESSSSDSLPVLTPAMYNQFRQATLIANPFDAGHPNIGVAKYEIDDLLGVSPQCEAVPWAEASQVCRYKFSNRTLTVHYRRGWLIQAN